MPKPPPPPPVSPPDPPPGSPPERAARVRYVRRLMALGFWSPGVSGLDLAELWGLSETTLKEDAAEASKQLQDAMPDALELRQHCLGLLERAKQEVPREKFAGKRAKLLADIAKHVADISGCGAPRKLQAQVTASDDSDAPWFESEVK